MKLFHAYMHLIIFLSLTATSPAVAKYAKAGCNDTCGTVMIPYPFGIGADCAVNIWYIVDCKNMTPYLSILKHLQVLGVDLKSQTVTVNTPRVTSCMSMNLSETPFFFSKSHNKFVFSGCGTAVMMDNGSVLTGCSAACLINASTSDINNCYGIGCCQAAIPRYLKSYNIHTTGIGEEDSACEYAFLVDETSYDQKTSYENPVSLLWTLTDFDETTCCYGITPERPIVDVFYGTHVDTLKCNSTYEGLLVDNPYLIDGCTGYESESKYAKTGCNDMCGKVRIPYPFGIGAPCSANEWYTVDCYHSTPYLSAFNQTEILSVNLKNQTVTVSTPMIADCQNPIRNSSQIMGVNLGRSPFLFSKSHNKFVFEGCGTGAMIMDNGSVVTGCSTTCHNNITLSDRNNCFGIGCCQTPIPHYLKSYTVNLIGLANEDGGCGNAFLVDETSYDPFIFGNYSNFVPISLLWTLDQVTCCDYAYEERVVVDIIDGTTMDTLECLSSVSSELEGNLYLTNGCKQNYGFKKEPTLECRRCQNKGGECDTEDVYDVDGVLSSLFNCRHYGYLYHDYHDKKRISVGAILGVSISIGVLSLVAVSYLLYKWITKTKEKRQRKRFFKRNGGLLLKQQEEADPSLVDKTIHFTSRDLQKATDNFNENRILGRGGQGTVYKGMLVDGRIVAVKKSKIVDESQLDQFINEVVILSQINHRNVVKLLGCCLETDVPVLVSEFVPNGTLYDRLHNNIEEFPLSLNMRLQIATEIAGALSYLHSAASIPIYHRDIKTTNILLDEKYRAKVSDFGTSRFVSIEQTHLTTLVKGTFGYLDPEYFQSSQFTEKSDVYSFGVVLVELLTGERPISLTRFGENRSLATHFMLAMEEGRVMSIFDAVVIKEGTRDELLIVANLAMRCLNLNGRYRPTMKEVAIELETIRSSHIPSMVQTNTDLVVYGEELLMRNYGESLPTFLSFNDSISQ